MEWKERWRWKERNCLHGVWISGEIGHKSGRGVHIFNKHLFLMQVVLKYHILGNTSLNLSFVWTEWIVNGAMERGQASKLRGFSENLSSFT